MPNARRYSLTNCAGSLGVQPEVESAGAVGVLMRCLLLFDILPKDVNGGPSAA